MKGLVIYDNSGTVVTIINGRETVPDGVQSVVSTIPDRIKSAVVDVDTKEVTFEVYGEDELSEG